MARLLQSSKLLLYKSQCLLLTTAYPIPCLSSSEEEPSSMVVAPLSRFVCESTERLVVLLCTLQSICLQRLSNMLQFSFRQAQKDMQVWKKRAEVLSSDMHTLKESFDEETMKREEAELQKDVIGAKLTKVQYSARQANNQFDALHTELQNQRQLNTDLEHKLYQFKIQFSKDTNEIRDLELAKSAEKLALTNELDLLKNRLSVLVTDASTSDRRSKDSQVESNESISGRFRNPRILDILGMEPISVLKKGSLSDLRSHSHVTLVQTPSSPRFSFGSIYGDIENNATEIEALALISDEVTDKHSNLTLIIQDEAMFANVEKKSIESSFKVDDHIKIKKESLGLRTMKSFATLKHLFKHAAKEGKEGRQSRE